MADETTSTANEVGGNADRLATDFESLKQSFSQFKEDVSTVLQDALGVGKAGANVVRDQTSSAVDRINGKLHELADCGSEAAGKVGTQIEHNPLMSAAIAFGAGYVLAKLFTRR